MDGASAVSPLRRVAVTGCGVVSPIGIGREAFAQAFLKGESGLRPAVGDYAPPLPCVLAGQVVDFDATRWLGKKGTRFLDRSTMLAIAAAGLALLLRFPATSRYPLLGAVLLVVGFGSTSTVFAATVGWRRARR